MEEKYPCIDCEESNYCDHWDAQYCCILCAFLDAEHCEDCDPMDI